MSHVAALPVGGLAALISKNPEQEPAFWPAREKNRGNESG